MVKSGQRAVAFEEEMVGLTRPYWERDVEALEAHARSLGQDELRPWDVAFLSEDLRLKEYEVDDEIVEAMHLAVTGRELSAMLALDDADAD